MPLEAAQGFRLTVQDNRQMLLLLLLLLRDHLSSACKAAGMAPPSD
jgi:hypothetical protein